MIIYKIVAIAITATLASVILKKTNPEYAIFLSIAAGVIIFSFVTECVSQIKNAIVGLADKFHFDNEMFSVVLKIIAVSYICEFASGICKDAGESSNASKVEMAGKIVIVFLTIPIIVSLADLIFSVL